MIAGGDGVDCRLAQPLDPLFAPQADEFAPDDHGERQQGEAEQGERDPAEPRRRLEQVGDHPLDGETDAEGDEAARRRPEQGPPGRAALRATGTGTPSAASTISKGSSTITGAGVARSGGGATPGPGGGSGDRRKARGFWDELIAKGPRLSGEPVADQELHRPVEADLRQMSGAAEMVRADQRRAKAREAQGAGLDGAFQHRLRPGWELAGEHCRLALAVEGFVTDDSPASGVPATARSTSPSSCTVVSRVARTEASATVPTRAPAASVRRMARETRRRRSASSRSWLV